MVAGRDSEKLVFFFRLVDVWLIFCGHSVCRKWAYGDILLIEIFSVDIKKVSRELMKILLFCGSLSVDIENAFWKYPLCRLNFFPWSFSVEIDKVSSYEYFLWLMKIFVWLINKARGELMRIFGQRMIIVRNLVNERFCFFVRFRGSPSLNFALLWKLSIPKTSLYWTGLSPCRYFVFVFVIVFIFVFVFPY